MIRQLLLLTMLTTPAVTCPIPAGTVNFTPASSVVPAYLGGDTAIPDTPEGFLYYASLALQLFDQVVLSGRLGVGRYDLDRYLDRCCDIIAR